VIGEGGGRCSECLNVCFPLPNLPECVFLGGKKSFPLIDGRWGSNGGEAPTWAGWGAKGTAVIEGLS